MAIEWAKATVDPKRRFRYKFRLGGDGTTVLQEYFVKTATMPKANISTIEHSYFDYNLKFPGRLTWDPISVTLVAPSTGPEDPTDVLYNLIRKAGYVFPNESAARTSSLSKEGFGKAGRMPNPSIQLLDGNGKEVEVWTLKNAFLTSVDYGGSLDYTSDEMLELTIEISFDWAERTKGTPGLARTPLPS